MLEKVGPPSSYSRVKQWTVIRVGAWVRAIVKSKKRIRSRVKVRI